MKYYIHITSFIFIMLSLCNYSYAEDFYWSVSGVAGKFSNPQSACDAYSVSRTQAGSGRYGVITKNSETSFNCVVKDSSGTSRYSTTVSRGGSGCTLPLVYNSSTSACELPPEPNGEVCGPKDVTGLPQIKNASGQCVTFVFADKPSQCNFFKNKVRNVATKVQFDSNGVPSGPPSVVTVGCVAVPVGPTPYVNCKQDAPRKNCSNGICIEMQSTVAQCTVTAQFTGEAADGEPGFTGNSGGGEGPCDPDKDCTPDTPPVVNDRQPCNYHYDSPERASCTSFDYKGVPGSTSQCGEVNGQMTCISKQPPTSNGTQIDTKVETKPNQDGTTTTTKTDVRTDVHCTGAGSCQSVTTKTTNVTIKDSNGNTLSSDTKCEGSKCSQGSGKGDGTGTGTGDCIVDCESQSGEVSGPELGEVSGFGESLTDFMSGVEQTPLMTAISGIGLTGSGSCSFPSATTMIGTISFDSICSNSGWLDPLYYVFMAIWAFLAVRVLMSA